MSDYVVEMLNITKRFEGVTANDNITLQLKKGEIHALLGENGAGKSTLMSILFGLFPPTEGQIRINGEEVHIKNPNDANDLGIGMVHEHFKLVDCFSVLDNIILGAEPVKAGFLKREQARQRVLELSEKYNLAVDPDALVENITVGMQQRTEILKMLYRNNEILIFDEPTAQLSVQEIEGLLQIIKGLAREGKSILFISHKLNEIMAIADRCTIIRKGKYIGTVDTKDTTPEKLSAMMVGRNVNFHVEKQETAPGDVVLSVRKMSVAGEKGKKDKVSNVSFDVRRGEIVSIAGIDGNGQTELIYGLSGMTGIASGNIFLNGKDISSSSVRKRSMMGISHIPEDRLKHGMVPDYSLEDNMILQEYHTERFSGKRGILKREEIGRFADKLIEENDIRSLQGRHSIVKNMSGGNQQKAVIARELEKEPDLLLAVQPIRGVDIGAIEIIHQELVRQRDQGKAILLVSLELDEVMDLSDRILVMYEGQIVGEFRPDQVTVEELGLYMTGAKRQEVSGNE